MSPRLAKRKSVYRDYDSQHVPDSEAHEEEEKTIPFLRRLTDMLQENEDVISFYPGVRQKKNHASSSSHCKSVLGRIVVHDRARVESEVLPRYFNHASFASLRRQLNYFSFTRIGKGRQRGATYCNEAVVDLQDILRLKRRAAGVTPNSTSEEKNGSDATTSNPQDTSHESSSSSSWNEEPAPAPRTATAGPVHSVVPVVHLPPSKRVRHQKINFRRANAHNSASSTASNSSNTTSSCSDDEDDNHNLVDEKKQLAVFSSNRPIALDLTIPAPTSRDGSSIWHIGADDDILAGCNALLSISTSFSGRAVTETTLEHCSTF